MDRIYELEGLLEDLAEEIEPYFGLMPEFMQKVRTTDKPLSIFSTTSFFPKLESIRAGLFELAKIEEHYSINILYRSLIEHFVKHQYLSLKTIGADDDSIGIDYWLFGQDKEILNFAKAAENSYRTLGITPPKPIDEILTEMGILDETKSKRLIQRKMEQFQYKNMINFIVETVDGEGVGSFLAPIFPIYSELSSYVHGGADTMSAYSVEQSSTESILDFATFASLAVRMDTYVHYYQFDKRAEPLLKLSQKYMATFTMPNKTRNEMDGSDEPPIR